MPKASDLLIVTLSIVMKSLGIHSEYQFYNLLKTNIPGISQKMLTVTLSMEDLGLVTQKIYPQIPPKVEYTITELGLSFLDKVLMMVEWAWDSVGEICLKKKMNQSAVVELSEVAG